MYISSSCTLVCCTCRMMWSRGRETEEEEGTEEEEEEEEGAGGSVASSPALFIIFNINIIL